MLTLLSCLCVNRTHILVCIKTASRITRHRDHMGDKCIVFREHYEHCAEVVAIRVNHMVFLGR